MIITSAIYTRSSSKLSECPVSNLPEFAFIGRSNVGKSSLINYISNNKNLSKTSKTPGKTKLINHFLINANRENSCYFVDLPGFGYARVSKEQRSTWGGFIEEYILHSPQNVCIFSLIDSSIPPQKIDIEFLTWLYSTHKYFAIVFTKKDKEKQAITHKNVTDFMEKIKMSIEEFDPNASDLLSIPTFEVSSAKKIGSSKILDFVGELSI
jgi:GTP-binding protein